MREAEVRQNRLERFCTAGGCPKGEVTETTNSSGEADCSCGLDAM